MLSRQKCLGWFGVFFGWDLRKDVWKYRGNMAEKKSQPNIIVTQWKEPRELAFSSWCQLQKICSWNCCWWLDFSCEMGRTLYILLNWAEKCEECATPVPVFSQAAFNILVKWVLRMWQYKSISAVLYTVLNGFSRTLFSALEKIRRMLFYRRARASGMSAFLILSCLGQVIPFL